MLTRLLPILYVGAGGMLGSVARYLCTVVGRNLAVTIPCGTLAANLGGCFIMGLVAQMAASTGSLSPSARLFLATGFCGGFTTLSSMIQEVSQYLQDGEPRYAALYVGLTLGGAMAAFSAGAWLVREWVQ